MSELVIGMYKIEKNILSKVKQCCKEVFFDLDVGYDICNIEESNDIDLIRNVYDILFINVREIISNFNMDMKKIVHSSKTHIVALADDVECLLYAFKLNSYRAMTNSTQKNEIKDIIKSVVDVIYAEEKIYIKDGEGINAVDVKNILYFEAFGDKSIIITKDNEYISNKTLKYWDDKLKNIKGFYRCHKSYLVCVQNISKIKESNIYFNNGKYIPIAVRKRKDLKRLL